MARTLLLLLASITIACTTVRVTPPPPAAEISGRWSGTWRAVDAMNLVREGPLDVDLAQDGAHGRGRMVWSTTQITNVPESIRLAGAMGVPVVFVVAGSSAVVRHELSAREFTMQVSVQGDDMVGTLDTSPAVEIRLTRVARPGAATVGERLLRLETDGSRERDRVGALDGRVTDLATRVDTARSLAEDAGDTARRALAMAGDSTTKASDTTTRIDELERRVREASVNGHATNGHADRALVHALDVRFAFNKWDLDDAGATALLDVIDLLRENPEVTAELEGYTDVIGSADYNVRLSQRRVDTVYRYLARRGVPLERMHVVGLGHLPDKDPDTRTRNRRVTVKLLMAEE